MNLSEVIVAINAAPRVGKRINWSGDLRTATNTACAIITAENAHMAIWNIYVDTGANRATLALMSRGCKPNGQVWPELRDAIHARGLTCRTYMPTGPRVTAAALQVDNHGEEHTVDVTTNDILVSRRIKYGTPEWCAKMVELNKKS